MSNDDQGETPELALLRQIGLSLKERGLPARWLQVHEEDVTPWVLEVQMDLEGPPGGTAIYRAVVVARGENLSLTCSCGYSAAFGGAWESHFSSSGASLDIVKERSATPAGAQQVVEDVLHDIDWRQEALSKGG